MDWTNEQRPPRPRSHWPLEQLIKNGGFGEKFFYDLEAGAGVKIQISHSPFRAHMVQAAPGKQTVEKQKPSSVL